MSHHFVEIDRGGEQPPQNFDPQAPFYVYLYPWSENEKSAVKSDGDVAKAIVSAADQLLNYGAIDTYRIYRWDWSLNDTNLPKWGDIDNCSYSDIKTNFKSFVKNEGDPSGTCGTVPKNGVYSMYDLKGVHQLIHGGSTGCNETAGSYAPAGAGTEKIGNTAFNEGRIAWSPVCSSNVGLTRAAAIQETTHMYIKRQYDQTTECESYDGIGVREHSLGSINKLYGWFDACTPMLAYHWDGDKNEDPDCVCPRVEDTPVMHIDSLTHCTKASVENTAQNV